ncbi:MAG: hypothetical protein QGH45_12550 [Myxococcota bacterium]|jgi:hypothetical protein|nr:hypothetical protein [Myxococcota bacterium]
MAFIGLLPLVAGCPLDDDDLAIDDLYLITVDDAGTLAVRTTTDKAWPELVSSYVSPGTGYFVDVDGPWIYLGSWGGGLIILDGTDPGSLLEVGSFRATAASESGSVVVRDGLAFVGEYANGLAIVDVSVPESPVEVGRAGDFAAAVALMGDLALAAGPAPVRIYDISDPGVPAYVDLISLFDPVNDLLVDGELVYMATDDGLEIVDLSDPTEPLSLGGIETTDRALGLALYDEHVFVAAGEAGVRGVDVSDPSNPVETWTDGWSSHANDVAIHGGWLWVADDAGGPDPYDVGNPDSPRKVLLESYSSSALKSVTPWPRDDS